MLDEETTFGDLHETAAKAHRIATQSSTYLLGVYSQGGRRSIVVRGEPGSDKQHVIVRDSDPRIDDRPLWDVPPNEWVGHVLEAGNMLTSRIKSVTEASDAKTIQLLNHAGMSGADEDENEVTVFRAPRPRERPTRERREPPAYPEGHVQYAEVAATYPRAIERQDTLFDDVAGESLLEDRLRVALAGCAVALDGIRRKVAKKR